MATSDQTRKEEHGGLSVARTEFASSLTRRLDAIQSAITALEQQAQSSARRDNLLRRLHALGASAKVLGFAAAAELLSRAEQQIRTGLAETLSDDLGMVRNQLATLPTQVLRGTYSMRPPPPYSPTESSDSPPSSAQGPWCVLVCGNVVLSETLHGVGTSSSAFELIYTKDASKVREMVATYGPDVIVLDAALDELEDQLRALKQAPETAGVRLVVALAAEGDAPRLQGAGADTVLTSNVSSAALRRAVNQTRPEDFEVPSAREPFGDVALRELSDRVSREIRSGLLDAVNADVHSTSVSLGEGTEIRAAIWTAVTRIREIVVAQSEGRVQFGPGPDGSVVMSPASALSRRGHALVNSESVDLTGRRIVVADDDPAVAWFVGGTLRSAGADVRQVQDGRRALNLVYQWWPELVVSDVLMPGLDGFALCREIKRDVALRDVPVILLSWKEDLLFRLRELGADADSYLRKEANASALVDRARELLWPRIRLEQRLRAGPEVRGRLDGIAPRTLIEATCRLERTLRIVIRDASAHYDLRIRDNSLRAIRRTRANGVVERGQPALSMLLGVSAGRFSVVEDDQPCDDDFVESSLDQVLRTPILRARAAQRVLSGSALGIVEQVTLDPETFADEHSMLPLSLRPLVDELLRGTAPRQLLASGTASLRGLESLLSDAARRGAVRAILGPAGEDLLTREILALSAPVSESPPADLSAPGPHFTFQLTPSPRTAVPAEAEPGPGAPAGPPGDFGNPLDGFGWTAEASWEVEVPLGPEPSVHAERSSPFSRPRLSAAWGSEKRTSPGVGTHTSARKAPAVSGASALNNQQDCDEPAGLTSPTAPESLEKQPKPVETSDLSLVVAAARAAEAASDSPAAQTLAGRVSPELDNISILKNGDAPPQGLDAADQLAPKFPLRAVENLTRLATVPEFTDQHELSPADAAPQLASRIEDEAIFPLFPSGAPSHRSRNRTPLPAVAVVPPPSSDTLPCELSPGPQVRNEVAAGSGKELPQFAVNSEDHESPEIVGASAGNRDPLSSDQIVEPTVEFGDRHPTVVEEPNGAARSAKAKTTGWLVPLSLALTTGLLSFAVALPIVQRLRSSPPNVAADSPTALDSVEAGTVGINTARMNPEVTDGTARALNSASQAAPNSMNSPKAAEVQAGTIIPPDKGLIVVKTGGVHSIFVDDEFVGRGPERPVTLNPGQHRIRISLNGEEHTETVEVFAGHAVQLSLEQSGK